MYSTHIGNGITALVGLLHSMIGISAIMHFGNGGLLTREEFYLYWWSTTSLVHVLFFVKLKKDDVFIFTVGVFRSLVHSLLFCFKS